MSGLRYRKIGAVLILAMMAFVLGSILLRFVVENLFVERLHVDNAFTRAVTEDDEWRIDGEEDLYVDWASVYPFDCSDSAATHPAASPAQKGESLKEKLWQYANSLLLGRDYYVSTVSAYRELIGWNLVDQENNKRWIDLGDGFYSYVYPRYHDFAVERADSINGFAHWLADRGVDFVDVLAPVVIYKDDACCMTLDYANYNADVYAASIAPDVNSLDLREPLYQSTGDYHAAFFRGDHHWTPQTAFWAAGYTARFINDSLRYDLDLALCDSANFCRVEIKNSSAGSGARIMGEHFLPLDDYVFVLPRYDMDLDVEVFTDFGTHYYKKGGFDAAFRSFPDFSTEVTRVNYGANGHGNPALVIIDNNLSDNDLECLILGDSFRCAYAPFLVALFKRTYFVDLRKFAGSIKSFVSQHDINLVIVVHSVGALGPVRYDHTDPLDFR